MLKNFVCLPGVYAGSDIPCSISGEFSHNIKSCPPKNPEKSGKGTKEWLKITSARQLGSFKTASNHEATRTICLTDWPLSGREKMALKPLFLSGFDSSSNIQPKCLGNMLLLFNDSVLVMLLFRHYAKRLIDDFVLYIHHEWKECVLFECLCKCINLSAFVQIICNYMRAGSVNEEKIVLPLTT